MITWADLIPKNWQYILYGIAIAHLTNSIRQYFKYKEKYAILDIFVDLIVSLVAWWLVQRAGGF